MITIEEHHARRCDATAGPRLRVAADVARVSIGDPISVMVLS